MAAQKLGEAVYAEAQAAGGGQAAGAESAEPSGGAGGAGKSGGGEDKVVDAEYTEVKDKNS